MALPLSRNTTYVLGVSQVKAADLNALQDAVIGGQRGSLPLVIPAASFTKLTGAATLSGGVWTGVGIFLVSLPFFVGTTIEQIKWAYNRGGGGTMTMTLGQNNPIVPTSTGPFAPAISAGTGHTVSTYSGADIVTAGGAAVLPADTGWTLQIEHTGGANVFVGVRIDTHL